MKKILITTCILYSFLVYAQEPNKDEIKAFKTAYLTEQLELSSSEAEKFWPIYNKYDSEIRELRKSCYYFNNANCCNFETLTNEKAKQILTDINAHNEKIAALESHMVNDLLNAISPIKILKLKISEKDFKRQLFNKYVRKKLDSENENKN